MLLNSRKGCLSLLVVGVSLQHGLQHVRKRPPLSIRPRFCIAFSHAYFASSKLTVDLQCSPVRLRDGLFGVFLWLQAQRLCCLPVGRHTKRNHIYLELFFRFSSRKRRGQKEPTCIKVTSEFDETCWLPAPSQGHPQGIKTRK